MARIPMSINKSTSPASSQENEESVLEFIVWFALKLNK